jgi:hypothetical protein
MKIEEENGNRRNFIKISPKPQYCSTLRSILNNTARDLTLKVGDQALKAHSFFLADQSLKFADLIKGQKDKVVEICDLTFTQLQELVNYIYNVSIDDLETKVEDIYPAAIKVPDLTYFFLYLI